MTPKFSKRILNKKKRSVRKYAVGGRPIKANWDKDIQEVLTFSSTTEPNKKLYVTKTYSFVGSSLYSIYSSYLEIYKFVFKKYCEKSFGGIGTCKIPKEKLTDALKELFEILGASADMTKLKTEYRYKDVDLDKFTTIADSIITKQLISNDTISIENVSTDDFLKKLNDSIETYYPKDKVECIPPTGDNQLLFNQIRDSPFTKLNEIFCSFPVEPTVVRDAAYKLKKHTINKILPDSVLSILNLKYKEPKKKDNLARECNESLKKATESMIANAAVENLGLLAKVGTTGASVVSGFMVAAGVSASTGFGLPVAAGLIALGLIANEIVKLANKNKEFKDLMFLIWCMCYRFENLINLMNVMAKRLEFDINKALLPVKEVMSRLIAQISALAPRSALANMKSQYMRDDGIQPPKEGDYNMTDALFTEAPEGLVYYIDITNTKEPNKIVFLDSSTGKVVYDPKPSQIEPPKGYQNYVDNGVVKWKNIKEPENIISASVYNKRMAENEDDKQNLFGKMKKSISRKLDRITSPDENYRILLRDITILSSWFSIIFSEFMLVVGSRNDVIKDIINRRHASADEPVDANSIEFIQKQLDFMNDIYKDDAYKRLIRDSLLTEVNKQRITNILNEDEQKLSKETKEKMLKIMADIQTDKDKATIKGFEKLINSKEIQDQIQESAGKIINSYKTLKTGDSIDGFKESIELLEKIETDNNVVTDFKTKCDNNECHLTKLPFIIHNTIMSVVYEELHSFVSNVPELTKKYECKYKKYKKNIEKLLETGTNAETETATEADCEPDRQKLEVASKPIMSTILKIHKVSGLNSSVKKIHVKIKWANVKSANNEYKTHDIQVENNKVEFKPDHEVPLGVITPINNNIMLHLAVKEVNMVGSKLLAENNIEILPKHITDKSITSFTEPTPVEYILQLIDGYLIHVTCSIIQFPINGMKS
jgi:hypothetical protein